ncbi:MAG TPA: PEP-utilizing enzyme, partial [Zeimonas sp.]|nr:PEP-utilizing enzyme [Zeimonas sp.]
HNHYIDLRATIPLRRAALATGAAAGARTSDDVFFLFYPELVQVARGERPIAEFEPLIDARRAYHAGWRARRKDMPKYLGAAPETINDPILIEIDGVTDDFLAAVRLGAAPGESLRGLGAAPGRAQGRARVLHGPQELHRVEAGEVLVCEGTSPSWTPAFTKIAACVCDQGGTLAHASIISREYRVPCVVGTAVATRVIADGDLVDVDGSHGTVTVLKGA